MNDKNVNWQTWRDFFAVRSGRRLPGLDDPQDYSRVPDSVARSLAIFQLGESGGGTIVGQARSSRIKSAGERYADAMQLFVAEEHRHAEILAICVRNLGGSLIRRNWTADLFVFARRLLGLRLKVLVLLVAEVVGICYYHLLATRLPASRLRSLLEQIVDDERSHLHFHCSFLRAEACGPWRRFIFTVVWRLAMLAAAIVTLVDHRAALRDLDLPAGSVWRRWMTYGRLAERLVTGKDASVDADRQILDGRCNMSYASNTAWMLFCQRPDQRYSFTDYACAHRQKAYFCECVGCRRQNLGAPEYRHRTGVRCLGPRDRQGRNDPGPL